MLVTGATGAVGPAVVDALREAGWDVRALVRGPAPPGVEAAPGDLRDHDSLRRAAQDVDAVVHMAGLLHVVFAAPELDADFRALNVEATRVLIDAARGKPFVFFSSISVYGSGGPFDETSPAAPETAYARTKLEAERIVLDAGGTVLRLAAVYGKRMKGNYATLVTAIARGRFMRIGASANHRTLVHDSDVARAVVLVLDTPRAAGEIYNVTDGTTHSLREIIDAVRSGFGKRPSRLYVPMFMARAVAIVWPKFRALLAKYREEVRVDGTKVQRELGFVPRADFAKAWAAAVRGIES